MQLWGANTLKNNKRIEVLATSTYLVAKMPWRDVLSILRANVIECLRMIKYQMAVGFCPTHVKKRLFCGIFYLIGFSCHGIVSNRF